MTMKGLTRIFCLSLGLGIGFTATDVAGQEAGAAERARVFLDCQSSGCDFDYLRREITWVDWVRDREDADVQILVTGVSAGGGIVYQIDFLGLRGFEGQDLSLTLLSSSTDTTDERREAIGDRIKVGLTGYAAATAAGEGLSVDYTDPAGEEEEQTGPENDPWNLWVFTVRLGGSYSGQTGVTGTSVDGSIGAARTSEDWKVRLGSDVRYSEDEFEFESDGEQQAIRSISRTQGTDLLLVRSLGPHWGIGGFSSFESSTFSNYDSRLTLQPALEFNVFPYEDSSRRTFTFQYRVGPRFVRYDEETVFEVTEDTYVDHALTAALALRQPWGNVSVSLSAATFLDDFEKNRLSAFANVSFRIVRGLSISLYGSASRVRDQINLPLRDATQDQVLLRRRILETDFTSYVIASLSYTFGSIFNNIVNPRLD